MLKIENLTFRYPHRPKPVIDDLSLSLAQGGIFGLLGPNGAGKSTLLYLISGLLTPKSGKVYFDGIDTRRRLPVTLRDIFIVPEEFTLPAVTLDTYIKVNAPFYPRFSAEDLARHLDTFGIADLRGYRISTLSMGQKKKIFMSFALACNTRMLIMDEPTNGLDIPGKAAFRRFIASSADDDKTIIISTHQVHDIDRILDHVIIMDQSHILLNASTADITARIAFLGTADKDLIDRALISEPAIGGAQIAIANDGTYDTELNLESLYNLCTTKPEIINRIFNSNPASQS